jgi:hypothetical protein
MNQGRGIINLIHQIQIGNGGQKFLAAGYKKDQVMELLLGIALKTISNYLDHISPTPVDPAFAAESK